MQLEAPPISWEHTWYAIQGRWVRLSKEVKRFFAGERNVILAVFQPSNHWLP